MYVYSVETAKEPLLSSSPSSYEPSFALTPYPAYRSSSPGSQNYTDISPTYSLSPVNETTALRAPRSPLPDQRESSRTTRPRAKSKPTSIFIHPTQSNIARADAAALHMGLAGDTELVKGNIHPDGEAAWKIGEGKDLAREIMGRSSTL
jgi:hypothetical protein